ncbi:aryl-sulfate sulfotransferase [Pectobacterium cacticida]|uniref:Arylsulfotransferase family protein n=1 Tax=Pectobacterium cacticida TaxID=69221 RepID=A0ABZ2GCD0_9GAMM|nr:aryl-sulfate sulfotransferase [Pectobacterium cacticida]UYX06903.1 aryl-sulfate sulfotransferase [Pectobacterium cacticida]
MRSFQTGLVYVDKEKAFPTNINFSSLDGNTHLVGFDGQERHRWNYLGLPGNIIDPNLINGKKGHVLLQKKMDPNEGPGIFNNITVGEFNWDGDCVWEWGEEAPLGAARQNHDWQRLANGNTLLLVTEPVIVKDLCDSEIGDQGIYEVSPDGKIVWSWMARDHFHEFGFSPEGVSYLKHLLSNNDRDSWGYLEINHMQTLGENKWYRAGHTAFHPDNIILDSRKGNFIIIIDKQSGKVVWRIGPYQDQPYSNADRRLVTRHLPRKVDQLAGQHHAHMIPEGLPGAGHILMLDDQGGGGYPPVPLGVYAGSRVLEIDPITHDIVWQYTAEDSGLPVWTFFTSFVGSVQRLPNGNTLINEGMNGRIFQVTMSGEIVWEYINPFPGVFPFEDKLMTNPMVYRAQAVPDSWLPG